MWDGQARSPPKSVIFDVFCRFAASLKTHRKACERLRLQEKPKGLEWILRRHWMKRFFTPLNSNIKWKSSLIWATKQEKSTPFNRRFLWLWKFLMNKNTVRFGFHLAYQAHRWYILNLYALYKVRVLPMLVFLGRKKWPEYDGKNLSLLFDWNEVHVFVWSRMYAIHFGSAWLSACHTFYNKTYCFMKNWCQ